MSHSHKRWFCVKYGFAAVVPPVISMHNTVYTEVKWEVLRLKVRCNCHGIKSTFKGLDIHSR